MPHVDQYTRRNDDDAIEGSFVQVQEGDHAGQVGAYVQTLERGKDGYPTLVLVQFKDATYSHHRVAEPYDNLRTVRGY